MAKTKFVDFKAVKAAITMEQVLSHYGLLEKFTRKGDSLSGPCPIHKGHNPTQFRVSVSKNVWNCFSECKHGGNTLDFIARMDDVSIREAAIKAVEWFGLDPDAMSGDSAGSEEENEGSESKATKQSPRKPARAEEPSGPNKPLKFRLDKLEKEHPYLTERGLTPETIAEFGVGFCSKGMMAERIAIPIHNPDGEVVAYAGRFPGEPDKETPKYKLPPGFKRSSELYNIDRAIKQPANRSLIIVEGFFDCMKLHQHGFQKVVALMGSTLSATQEQLLRKHVKPDGHVIVMLDEDEAGSAGRDDIALRLSKFYFVKVHVFPKQGMQPADLSADEITRLFMPNS